MRRKWSNLETFTMLVAVKRGHSYTEIADVLHRTSKAVERRIWRVKRSLTHTPMRKLLVHLDV